MLRHLPLALLLLLVAAAPSHADATPQATVKSFYDAYMKSSKAGVRMEKFFATQKARVEPTLYAKLMDLMANDPNKDKSWLDFDPFINAQVDATSYRLGKEKLQGGQASVAVMVTYSRAPETLATRVQLRQIGGSWRITNFVYPARDGARSWDLRSYLDRELAR